MSCGWRQALERSQLAAAAVETTGEVKKKKKKGKQMTLDAMLPKHAARVRSPPLSIMPASSCQAAQSVGGHGTDRDLRS